MIISEPPELATVLAALHVSPAALLGHGGEARVYALDDRRVVRIGHGRLPPALIARRQQLVDELRSHGAPFELPDVLDAGEIAGRSYTIERRFPGVPVTELLATMAGRERDVLIEHHLDAAAALGSLHLDPRGWFGELLSEPPLRASTWQQYLVARAARSVQLAPAEFHQVDLAAVASGLPECARPGFVHLDAFAGNMLAVGSQITAVLDVGATSLVGDPRLDPLSCAVYLSAPQITPAARPRDVEVAMSWLRTAGLADWFEPARRWCAAFWSFAVDDTKLHRWCRSVLIPGE